MLAVFPNRTVNRKAAAPAVARISKQKLGALCEQCIVETVLDLDKYPFDLSWKTLFLLWMEDYTQEDERAYLAWRKLNKGFWTGYRAEDNPYTADPVRLDALAKGYSALLESARPPIGKTLHDIGEALVFGHYSQPVGLPNLEDFRLALAADGIPVIEGLADVPEEVWNYIEPCGSHLSTVWRWRNSGVPESGPITFDMIVKNELLLLWTHDLATILWRACEELWNSGRAEYIQRSADLLLAEQRDHSGEHLKAAFKEIDPDFEGVPTPADLIALAEKEAELDKLAAFIDVVKQHVEPREGGALPEAVLRMTSEVAPVFVEFMRDWEILTLSVVVDWWDREGRTASVGLLTDGNKNGGSGETEAPPSAVKSAESAWKEQAFLSARSLKAKFGVPELKRHAMEQALSRLRNDEAFMDKHVQINNEPGKGVSRFTYRVSAVEKTVLKYVPEDDSQNVSGR